MTVLKICGAAAIFIIITLCFLKGRTTVGFFVGSCLCLMIFVFSFDNIFPVISYIKKLTGEGSLTSKYIPVLIKTLGIGFIASGCAGMCREAGENSVGTAIEFFAKTQILLLALPILKDLLALALKEAG